MKIKSISVKNFLSFGNTPTTYEFKEGVISVITGINGSGKSTMFTDALFFVLTGKPYRNINKADLVNTTNKKNCLVELYFENIKNYKVVRGIKPNIFEIYCSSNTTFTKEDLIDQDSHSKEYQQVLEDITRFTEFTIKQVLILSNNFYTPFLRLKASDKREFIETILGITLFSDMNENIKKRLVTLKQEEGFVEKDIERINSNIKIIKEFIDKSTSDSEQYKLEIENNINNELKEIEKIKIVIESKEQEKINIKEKRQELRKYLDYRDKVYSKLDRVETDIKKINKDINFYETNESCPTCKQKINQDDIVVKLKQSLKELDEEREVFKKKADIISKAENKDSEYQGEITQIQIGINKLEAEINYKVEKINEYKKSLNKLNEVSNDNESKLISLNGELNDKTETKLNLTKEKKNVTIVQKMLGDKFIKKFVMGKYLPVLNQYVNYYLDILDAKYKLIINDELDVKIIARGYEDLSEGSFSAGETQRCNLALIFSFLELAKMKNNINCNLLICDELFGDLDVDGINGLDRIFTLLKGKDYAITMITHDDKIKELADVTYKVSKQKFSKMEIL